MAKTLNKLKIKISKTLDALKDSSYDVYTEYANERLFSLMKLMYNQQGLSSQLLWSALFFHENKKQWVNNKAVMFEQLINIEKKFPMNFNSDAINIFEKIYSIHKKPKNFHIKGLVTATLINDLFMEDNTDYYCINPFTDDYIKVNINGSNTNCCFQTKNRHLYTENSHIANVFINKDGVNGIIEEFKVGLFEKESIIRDYIVYHELAHDSHFQNYLNYQDIKANNKDYHKEVQTNNETQADIASIIMIIKERKLAIDDALSFIQAVMTFRNNTFLKAKPDQAMSCVIDDTTATHTTQPGIVILLRMIKEHGLDFIYKMKGKEISSIAYQIGNISVDTSYREHIYRTLLPKSEDDFKLMIDDGDAASILAYYSISYVEFDDVVKFKDINNITKEEAFFVKNIVINYLSYKLYNPLDVMVRLNAEFRVKFSFEYMEHCEYQGLIELLRSKIVVEYADLVYKTHQEVSEKEDDKFELIHTRNNIEIALK